MPFKQFGTVFDSTLHNKVLASCIHMICVRFIIDPDQFFASRKFRAKVSFPVLTFFNISNFLHILTVWFTILSLSWHSI